MRKIIKLSNWIGFPRQILIMLILVTTGSHYLWSKTLTIKKASAPMSISSAEWNKFAWNTVDLPYGDTTGFSGKFKMCYDSSHIYVLVSVHDATPNQVGFASWASDCVELYFAMDTSNSYAYRYGDWEFRKQSALSLSDGGVEAYDLNGSVSIDYLINQTEFGVNQIDGNNGYLQYWQLPVDILSKNTSFDGQDFRFDIQLVNNNGSGSKTGALFWNSTAGDQWRRVQNQGYVLMSGKTVLAVSKNELVFQALSSLEETVYITGDDTFAITANVAWVHFAEGTYNGKRGLKVWVDNNTALSDRQGSIKLVSVDYELNISILQKAFVHKTLTIKKASAPMSISSAEWNKFAWNTVDIPYGDTTGFSGKFKMCYDDNNIYVLVSVYDATPFLIDANSWWQSDCVELYFAMDTSNSQSYRYGDWVFNKEAALDPSEGGVHVFGYNSYYSSIEDFLDAFHGNFAVEQIDGNNSYLQYWQLPINDLSYHADFNGKYFRFEIHLTNYNGSDNYGENGRIGSLWWNSNANDQWGIIEHHGYVFMSSSISVSKNQLIFGATSNLVDSVYLTGDDTFSITAKEEWVHFAEGTYNGKRGIKVWVDKNTSAASRQDTISLVAADYTLTISVMQEPLVKATLSKNELVFGATSNLLDTVYLTGEDTFSITAKEGWLHFAEGTYNGKRGIKVWVDKNTSAASRQDTISLVAADYTLTIPVWQNGYVGVPLARTGNLKIYPNPASDKLTIISNGSQINWIRLMDLNGREIAAIKIQNRQANIDIHQLKPGIYFITVIQSDGSVVQQKFQKK